MIEKRNSSYRIIFLFLFIMMIQYTYAENIKTEVNLLQSINIIEKRMLFFSQTIIVNDKDLKFHFISNEIKKISKNITEVRKAQTNIFFSDYISVNFNQEHEKLWVFWGNEKKIIKKIELALVNRNKNIPIIVNNKLTFFISYKKYKEFVYIVNLLKKRREK